VPQSDVHQVIVKLRGTASAAATSSGQVHVLSAHERLSAVAIRVGLTMDETRPITDKMHIVRVRPAVAGETIAATVARLQADSEVEYAEPDQRRYAHAVPNDPLYPAGLNPNNTGQWYLQANTAAVPAAVNFAAAWDTTTGDPNLVIADIDTGVRYDHPDLLALAANGRLLPGYDFITDINVANDGNGRDSDASDPGDWVTSSDAATSQFKSCKVENSSWHGTRTAGVLGALTNNATGVAGTTWLGKILPVRALGKCGGQDSDIVAAMLWAAGIHVTNVPDNPIPPGSST
jgi:serine protease